VAVAGVVVIRGVCRWLVYGEVKVMAKKYRKKPIAVEAMQVPEPPTQPMDFYNWGQLGAWLGSGANWRLTSGVGSPIEIETLEGKMTANIGDWIIRGIRGELYPVRRGVFEESYEEVP
jgi:hypothetical protein